MVGIVKMAFEDRTIVIPLTSIILLKALAPDLRKGARYKRIAASIAEVGIIEPIVVSSQSGKKGSYLLLDGNVRLAILTERGETEVRCLVAIEEDTFTYNKRVSHLPPVQEHLMIMKALDRGVPEKKIADALNVDVDRIKRQRNFLNGICKEAVDMLKDKQVPSCVFAILRRMGSARQAEVIELMTSCGNFTGPYASALLAGTRQADLARPDRPKKVRGLSAEQMARMEREMTTLQNDFKSVESTYGNDMLELIVASGYVAKLLRNPQVERYLSERYAELIEEFRTIVVSNTLKQAA